jgi:hypothetical protein
MNTAQQEGELRAGGRRRWEEEGAGGRWLGMGKQPSGVHT